MKHSLYFMSGLALLMLSGCASNQFNEYWETKTTHIEDISYNKPTTHVVKEIQEDRSVQTFKVESPQEKVSIESSLSEGEEIFIPESK